MPTNLAINDRLLNRAKKLGGFRTKRETVDAALTEFIRQRNQRAFLELAGTVTFRDDWDYKQDRKDRVHHR